VVGVCKVEGGGEERVRRVLMLMAKVERGSR